MAVEPGPGVITLTSGSLNVRSAPGGEILTSLPGGTEVQVNSAETDASGTVWYNITASETTGFVSSAYVALKPLDSELCSQQSARANTACDIYSAPDASYGRITSPGQNTSLSVLAQRTVGESLWYYVRTASGRYGWCAASAVSPVDTTASGTQEEYNAYLSSLGFPESYFPGLWQLHQLYPQWSFVPQQTGLDWSAAVAEESALGKSLVQSSAPSSWKSTQDGAYNWTTSTWVELDSGGWVQASGDIIAYYMDPRNFLTSDDVFQFLSQSYDGVLQTREGLAAMVAGTFLANDAYDTDLDGGNGVQTYVNTLYDAGAAHGVSPYILAAMMLQEMGISGASQSISGTNGRFPGCYTAFNIGAYKPEEFSAVERGLWYASGGNGGVGTSYGRPWTTLCKAIFGGTENYSRNYTSSGQNTLYLKRFNVQGDNMYWNQYMTNVSGACSEGKFLASAYTETMRAAALSFSIPVYLNMPGYCPQPSGDGSPNTGLSSLTVSSGGMTPAFDRSTYAYTVIVPFEADAVTVSADALSSGAVVNGTGSVTLAVGANTHRITVTAENGAVSTYTLTILRQENAGPVSVSGIYTLSGGRITGIQPGTAASRLLEQLGVSGGTPALTDASGSALSGDAPVATGHSLTITYDNSGVPAVYGTYGAVIYGDISGDGGVQINDLILLRNHLLGSAPLSGPYLAAADISRDGNAQINDLILLRNALLGTSTIPQ